MYLLFLLLKNKNQNSNLRAFSSRINIFDIFDVETYFTVCLRLKKVLNSLSNITEDINAKSSFVSVFRE